MPPSLSIVVPSFNQSRWIGACLESIAQQLSPQDQLIVVDACSTDGTKEILERYVPYIDHLIIEPDNGQACALAKGFSLATGEIFAYLNTDDLLLPGTLDFVKQYFQRKSDTDALYSHRVFIDQDDQPFNYWLVPFHSNYCMERWDYIPQETCFWRRSLMECAGDIDAGFQFAVDYDLFVRMMRNGRFSRVNRFLACFRDHPASKTNSLYETQGREEVQQVQTRYDIKFHWYDRLVGNLYGQAVLQGGMLFRVFLQPILGGKLRKRIGVYAAIGL